jgi:hypothetical protein
MGDNLYGQFSPGQAELNGVAAPYADWAQQLLDAGCTPSVAQALLPYPQYCSGLYGLNENAGNSTYHSLQLKVEKRFTAGIYLLGAYTFSKLLTDAGHVDSINLFGAYYGVFSPFERQRNKALANDDVPQVFNATLIYELPFGQGKKFMSSSRAADLVLGGWSVASITRFSSGLPYYFRIGGSACKLPGQFQAACVPAINGDPFAQDKGSFDPGSGSPLFNKDAFEPISAFQFYGGAGPKISNFRNYGFKNQDLAIYKNFRIKERMKFQIRGEFFNLFNWHNFVSNGNWGGQAFSTDLTASDFGQWNGSVTSPRNIQLGARFEF